MWHHQLSDMDHVASFNRTLGRIKEDVTISSEFTDVDMSNSAMWAEGTFSESFLDESFDSLDEMMLENKSTEVMTFRNTNALCTDLRFITEIPEMCDVKFLVGNDKTPIHAVKAILAARSRVFYELFLSKKKANRYETPKKKFQLMSTLRKFTKRNNSKRSRSDCEPTTDHITIDIDEYKVDVFRHVIVFLHCGNAEVNINCVVGVMNAADKYGVEELRSACFRFGCRSMNLKTVLNLLSSTEPYVNLRWTKCLQTKIMDFISQKAQDVLRLPEFEGLSKRIAILIFMQPDLKATEEAKWDAALRWGRRHCQKREVNYFRRIMKIFCRRINFNDIPAHKLANEIRPLSILADDVIDRALAHRSCPRLVIGQERRSSATPQKPPRKRLVARSLVFGDSSLHPNVSTGVSLSRKSSSASTTSGTPSSAGYHSGFSSSSDDCSSF